tara:strand:- start:202 stop:456 length:255 start_codon:yes stop_codon:yes gene_type:complete
MTTIEKKLIILAAWLTDYKANIYPETGEGAMETACKRAVEEAVFKIGDTLMEIMGATPELTDQFFKDCEKPCKTDVCTEDTRKL